MTTIFAGTVAASSVTLPGGTTDWALNFNIENIPSGFSVVTFVVDTFTYTAFKDGSLEESCAESTGVWVALSGETNPPKIAFNVNSIYGGGNTTITGVNLSSGNYAVQVSVEECNVEECNYPAADFIRTSEVTSIKKYYGLSVMPKPSFAPFLSIYEEFDTNKKYYYDGEQWYEFGNIAE